jgi:hypothetical protein
MSDLFAVDVSTINYHLKQLDETGEVLMSEAIRKIPILSDKWDEQGVLLYNLDAIIAVGYRVGTILSDFDRFIEIPAVEVRVTNQEGRLICHVTGMGYRKNVKVPEQ